MSMASEMATKYREALRQKKEEEDLAIWLSKLEKEN